MEPLSLITVSASFKTYVDFEVAFDRYKQTTNTVFTEADSKTVSAENRKLKDSSKAYLTLHLFHCVHFNCKHFGNIHQESRPSKKPRKWACD